MAWFEYKKDDIGEKFVFVRNGVCTKEPYEIGDLRYEERTYRDGHWVCVVRKDHEIVRVDSNQELIKVRHESGLMQLTIEKEAP
ncbi:hypothetical protein [Paenibacillus amylolyticus]|uniref:hypothetical protein n=1 Tax=Paenibacillus amylolyticus TaxID=1451 RepID=UPI00249A4DC7|nr:hypothetical protein [Paenibacillus amylolyticus]WFA86501.1 hypothetical protein OGI70_06120 [Paenibacillus amylolyticus]